MSDGIHEEEISNMEQGSKASKSDDTSTSVGHGCLSSPAVVTLLQKVIAEAVGTYFVIFSGCGAVAVNNIYGKVSFPGICVTWGLIVMVMIYTVGHISGAHFNPAVTIAFAIFGRFPWKEVPFYIISQLMGWILASCTLAAMFDIDSKSYFGTLPVGSNGQSLAAEIVITFLLMFVVSAVGTDSRAVGELGGVAIGMTIMLNVFVAGPVSGASMNPARSIGPSVVKHVFQSLWVYIVGPLIGAVAGAFVYNLLRHTQKPLSELTTTSSIFKDAAKL